MEVRNIFRKHKPSRTERTEEQNTNNKKQTSKQVNNVEARKLVNEW